MSGAPSLGTLMSNLRTRKGLTLREMSAATCIPLSTLAKVEHDRLTLSYDKIQQVCGGLSVKLSDLLLLDRTEISGWRSISRAGDWLHIAAPDADYYNPQIDLKRTKMAPTVVKVRAKPGRGEPCSCAHAGEEFIYVVEGRLEVHTELYVPAMLERGESIYIDANMAHALFAGVGCEEATCLVVLSGPGPGPAAPLHRLHADPDS
jgi:transcriptional regulator with XRE-family HTH domain